MLIFMYMGRCSLKKFSSPDHGKHYLLRQMTISKTGGLGGKLIDLGK